MPAVCFCFYHPDDTYVYDYEMESLEVTSDICRICLEQKENINWNDKITDFCEISYKDFYYRYTQLNEPDLDCYPTNLCAKCADKIRNAHMLFEMALESFKILQKSFKANELEVESPILKVCSNPQETIFETPNEEAHIEIDELMCFSPSYDVEPESEFNELVYEENSESSFEIPPAQQPTDFNIKLQQPVEKEKNCRSKYLESFGTTLELKLELEIHGSKLFKLFDEKMSMKNGRKSTSASKCSKSSANDYIETIERTRSLNHNYLSSITSQDNQIPKWYDTKSVIDETYHSSDHSLMEPNPGDEHKNADVTTNFEGLKEFKTNYHIEYSEETRNSSDSSNCLFTETIHTLSPLNHGNKTKELRNSSVSGRKPRRLVSTGTKSRELQRLSVSDDESHDYHNSIKNNEKTMLLELFGKDFDINALMTGKRRKPRELMCQYCSVKVNGGRHLRAHEATHLDNRERKMVCPICGMKFYTKESLNGHKKTHDKNRQKKYKCDFCEKAFFHGGALNVHKRIHLGLMVKCQLCPKEFYRQIDLDRHLPSHSATALQNSDMSLKQKKYTVHCHYCNGPVLTTKWRAHKAAHLNQPQVKCKICDKDFFSRHSCASHLKKTHRKARSEIEENIHYYVDWSRRMSHLMMKQQENLMQLSE